MKVNKLHIGKYEISMSDEEWRDMYAHVEAREDGWDSYMEGLSASNNPHSQDCDSALKKTWHEGWVAASLHGPQD